MTKEKLFNYYKRGEWLLYVAVLFQIINILIITVKHVESGMGVFKERFLGIVSAGILFAYVCLELVTLGVEIILLAKNKTLGEYCKQNWWKIALKLVLLILTLVFAVYGMIRYYTDRLNFNLDYDTTNLTIALALLFGCLYGFAKNIKLNWLDIVVTGFSFALAIVFIIVTKVTLSNFLWSFKANVYMLTSVFLMLFIIISLASTKINFYISCFFEFAGLCALLASSIIGGVYGFTELDLFYFARLCVVLSSIMGLCFVVSFLNKLVKEITKENYKQKLASLLLNVAAVAILLTSVFHVTEMEIVKPSSMHLLDISFMLASTGIVVGFVSVMLRKGIKIVDYLFAGVATIFTLVMICILNGKSKLVPFIPFYKTSLILSIGFLVIMVIYLMYYIALNIYKMVRKAKLEDTAKN